MEWKKLFSARPDARAAHIADLQLQLRESRLEKQRLLAQLAKAQADIRMVLDAKFQQYSVTQSSTAVQAELPASDYLNDVSQFADELNEIQAEQNEHHKKLTEKHQ